MMGVPDPDSSCNASSDTLPAFTIFVTAAVARSMCSDVPPVAVIA